MYHEKRDRKQMLIEELLEQYRDYFYTLTVDELEMKLVLLEARL